LMVKIIPSSLKISKGLVRSNVQIKSNSKKTSSVVLLFRKQHWQIT